MIFDMCFQEKRPCRASFNMCFTFYCQKKLMYSSTQQLVSKYMKSLSLMYFTNQDYKSFWENKTILFALMVFLVVRIVWSVHYIVYSSRLIISAHVFLFGRFLQIKIEVAMSTWKVLLLLMLYSFWRKFSRLEV